MNKAQIIQLFKDFGCTITQDDIWQVQAATVIKHKALERLAASANITFEPPTIIRAGEAEAVILATGRLKDRVEWSIGEALVNVNYRVSGKQAAYVYAMAEKRAKDRVILKLAGLHGLYSEDEADEFQQRGNAPASQLGAPLPPHPAYARIVAKIKTITDAVSLGEFMSNAAVVSAMDEMSSPELNHIHSVRDEQLASFERIAA